MVSCGYMVSCVLYKECTGSVSKMYRLWALEKLKYVLFGRRRGGKRKEEDNETGGGGGRG